MKSSRKPKFRLRLRFVMAADGLSVLIMITVAITNQIPPRKITEPMLSTATSETNSSRTLSLFMTLTIREILAKCKLGAILPVLGNRKTALFS